MPQAVDHLQHLQRIFAGRYVVERELGRGGMATVYLARDVRHSRLVAIKVFHSANAAAIEGDRFRAEIEIAAALAHPGILPVFDSGGEGDVLYYVMPYIAGESLRALLVRQPRLDVDLALRIARDVGDALSYAHAHGIIHRDIKPENILLVEPRAVVADFGIARALAHATESSRLTMPGTALGTPLYMSPEQASGDRDVDARSDIYSLAAVVYEMLAGTAPHGGDTPQQIIARKLAPQSVVPPIERADVPDSVQAALRRALAGDPAMRFQTTGEFVEALMGGAIDTPPPYATRPRTLAARLRRVSRPRLLVGAVAGAVLLAAAGVTWWRATRSPVVADSARVAIAILPFRATVPSAGEWAEAVPDLLATALDGTPGVRVVDPWALWRTLRSSSDAVPRAPDPAEAAILARRARASHYVLGSIAHLQGRVEIALRVYRAGHDEPWQVVSFAGAADSIAAVVQHLALDLIGLVSSGDAPATLAHFDRGLTRSPAALKAWLSAREFRRRGQIDSAYSAIQKAMTFDSTFAYALIDAVGIESWLQYMRGQPDNGLVSLAERAVQLSDSLSDRQRLRAIAMLASVRTEGARAADALERIVAIDSSDVEAWGMLSYVNLVYGWQFGRGEQDAAAAGEQSLRLDSTDAPNLSRLMTLAISTNDTRRIDAMLRRLRAIDTTTTLVRGEMRATEAARASDADFLMMVDQLTRLSVPEWLPVLRTLRVYAPDRAELLTTRLFTAQAVTTRRVGLGALVQLLAAQSRWTAIDSLRRSGGFAVVVGFERVADRLAVAASIAGVTDDATGRRAVNALSAALPPDSALAWLRSHPVWLEGWLVGAWHAMYGDTATTRRWDSALATLPEGGTPAAYAVALRADLASRLAARRGDRANALRYAERALNLWTIHASTELELMPEPAMRFQLASLLRAAGKRDSAAALFRSLVPPTTWMGFYTARAALELGELSETRGDRVFAEREFLTALRLWERGDSVIAPFRDRARRGALRDKS